MQVPRDSCVQPARGPLVAGATSGPSPEAPNEREVKTMLARVGKEAPDFEAHGFFEGGFRPFKLSEYRGKWVVLCFYPGDFTFV